MSDADVGKGGGRTIDDACVYCSAAPAHRTRLRIGAAGFCSEICEYEALKPDNWDQMYPPTEDGPDAESHSEDENEEEEYGKKSDAS